MVMTVGSQKSREIIIELWFITELWRTKGGTLFVALTKARLVRFLLHFDRQDRLVELLTVLGSTRGQIACKG